MKEITATELIQRNAEFREHWEKAEGPKAAKALRRIWKATYQPIFWFFLWIEISRDM